MLPGANTRPCCREPHSRLVALTALRSSVLAVALDARTGELAWETEIEAYGGSYYMTLAPVVAGANVMAGVFGGERGCAVGPVAWSA